MAADPEPHAVIRELRKEQGLTQAQLARRAGLPQSHLAKIEAGKVDMQLSTLRRLFRALGRGLCVTPTRVPGPGGASVARDRAPVRMVDREEEGADLAYWLGRPPGERVAAVELLREQYYAMSGYRSLPRLARELQLKERRD